MRNNAFIPLLLLCFYALSAGRPCLASGINGGERGGGDAVAQQFTEAGRQAYSWLVLHSDDISPQVDASKFLQTLLNAQIVSTDQPLTINVDSGEIHFAVPKDIVNYPAYQVIIINRSRWATTGTLGDERAIACHEIFGLMGLNDSGYQISGNLLASELGGGTPDVILSTSSRTPNPKFLFTPERIAGLAQAALQGWNAIQSNTDDYSLPFQMLNDWNCQITEYDLGDGVHEPQHDYTLSEHLTCQYNYCEMPNSPSQFVCASLNADYLWAAQQVLVLQKIELVQ